MSVLDFNTPALWEDTFLNSPPLWWNGTTWEMNPVGGLFPGAYATDGVTNYTLPAGTVITVNVSVASAANNPLTLYFYNDPAMNVGATVDQVELIPDAQVGVYTYTLLAPLTGVAWAAVNAYSGFSTPTIDSEFTITFAEGAEAAVPVNYNCDCEDAPAETTSLAALRRKLLIRLGYAAVVNNPPPGMAILLDEFLRDAQNHLYLAYPALRTRRFFRWSMTQGERFYGMRANDEDDEEATVTISVADPAVVTWPVSAPENGQAVSFVPVPLTVGGDASLPYPLRKGTRYYVVNRSGATHRISLTPGGTALAVTSAAVGTITATSYPSSHCTFNMEPYKAIEGAWIVDANGAWIPLHAGIPPTWYTTVNQQGLPARYEIRECLEVFPAPNSNAYKLYIKGHFGLRSFETDHDQPTLDGDLVYLWALGNAKAHYGQPDADAIMAQAQNRLRQLVAGTHLSRRYVPGTTPIPPAAMPIFLPLVGP